MRVGHTWRSFDFIGLQKDAKAAGDWHSRTTTAVENDINFCDNKNFTESLRNPFIPFCTEILG